MPAHIIGLRVVLAASLLGAVAYSSQEPVASVSAAQPLAADARQVAPASTPTPVSTATAHPSLKPPLKAVAQQASGPAAAQAAKAATPATKSSSQDLPPISYICTMPGDEAVLEDKPGKCPNPKCGMDLKPIRIVQAWSCLSNTAFIQDKPGKCRTDGTDLVPINVSMYWACVSTPDKHQLTPDKCADGSAPVKKYEPRPHGDHNPRHGGTLFMADDAWHHVEGAYPSAGLFRVYFYDDFTKPMAPKGFAGRAVMKDLTGKDIAAVPLKAGRISNTMEARIPDATLPLVVQLQVGFKPGDRERKFDFSFQQYTKDSSTGRVSAPATASQGRGSAPATGRGRAGAPVSAKAAQPAPYVAPPNAQGVQQIPGGGTVEFMAPIIPQEDPVPNNSKDILAELAAKTEEVESLIKTGGGGLAAVWLPALRTKNLALALLDDHLNEIPDRDRPVAQSAVYRLLLAAWQIDTLGDLGDQSKILTVHAAFTAAVADLNTAYASLR